MERRSAVISFDINIYTVFQKRFDDFRFTWIENMDIG